MACVVTTIHDPIVLAATCQQLHLPPPTEGSVRYESQEVFGWLIRLPRLRFPLLCDTVSGLLTYHPLDGVFSRYRDIVDFLRSYQVVRGRMLWGDSNPATTRKSRSLSKGKAV